MDVNIQATYGVCSEFIDDKGERRDATNIIAPLLLTVTEKEEQSKVAVKEGCNLWKSCQNKGCYYSLIARQRKQ